MRNQPSIAIVGGGPGGLTLARLLAISSVPLTISIFEKDASPTSRASQGGSLDLHRDTGLAAIRTLGLWDEFQKHARYEGEELIISDKNATEFVHVKAAAIRDGPSARPEIDRERLQEVLHGGVDDDLIHWGKALSHVEADNGVLVFKDGSKAGPFDLIVGADGAWSKVRPVLSETTPHYSGICGFRAKVRNPKTTCPDMDKVVGKGSHFTYSSCQSLNAQQRGDNSITTSMYRRTDESWVKQVSNPVAGNESYNDEALKQTLLGVYHEWDHRFKNWIRHSEQFHPYVLYELPVGFHWSHRKGYTLLGDAAHLMTPFAGEGVNVAMRDALELSECINTSIQNGGDLDQGLVEYEKKLFPRVEPFQARTMRNKIAMFHENSPVSLATMIVDKAAVFTGFSLTEGVWGYLPIKQMVGAIFQIYGGVGWCRRKLRDMTRTKD